MLDSKGFDLWADGYDRAVRLSDEGNTYPFAGYREVLGIIFRCVTEKPGAEVLDIGFGTGTLTVKLYDNGCRIFGQDFSPGMIAKASARMPGAGLYQGDFALGLAEPLLQRKYDFIVSTYALHHLTDGQKTGLLHTLTGCLKEGGKILIGDVAFGTRADLERCRREAGGEWDDEEYYFVADELKRDFPQLIFRQVSFCAGILSIPQQQ